MTESSPRSTSPKVTIAIPTLNRVCLLQLAVESALRQTYRNIEVVVSNNASTDGTAQYLACCLDTRLRVVTQSKTIAMVENWNACVSVATGEYLLLLSDDDVLEPDAIRALLKGFSTAFEGRPCPAFVYGGGRFVDQTGAIGRSFRHSPQCESAKDLIPAFFDSQRDLWFCAILFRKCDIYPGFDATYPFAADSALWIATVIKYQYAVFIAADLVQYRIHQGATSSWPLDIWKIEIDRLAHTAIEQMQTHEGVDRQFTSRVHSAVKTLKLRTVAARINSASGGRWLAALNEYRRQLPEFLTLSGLWFLLRGVVSLTLPQRSKTLISRFIGQQHLRSNR